MSVRFFARFFSGHRISSYLRGGVSLRQKEGICGELLVPSASRLTSRTCTKERGE